MKLLIPLVDGRTLTFEGEHDELVAVAEKFAQSHPSQVSMETVSRGTPETVDGSRRWTERTTKRLWGMLYGEQAKVVRFLVDRGGKVTYSELAKHMGYKGQHLSGILSPLTRNAQAATGDRLARIIDWRIDKNSQRQYYIQADALPHLRLLLREAQ
jgi:hypothetical protein